MEKAMTTTKEQAQYKLTVMLPLGLYQQIWKTAHRQGIRCNEAICFAIEDYLEDNSEEAERIRQHGQVQD